MSATDRLAAALRDVRGVRLAVLFGSAARGKGTPRSDLDVGVLLDEDAPGLGALAVSLSRAAGREVDLVLLAEAPPLLRFEVARDGVVILASTPHAWADFKARAMVDWWDWAPTARMIHARALARLREGLAHGQA
jgi:uncharacterized protein